MTFSKKRLNTFLYFMVLIFAGFPILLHEKNAAYSEMTQGEFSIQIKKDLLTVNAKGANLKSILFEIEKKSDIKFSIDPKVNKQITIKLDSVPLENALKQLIKKNYAIRFVRDPKTNRTKLIKIGVFSSSDIQDFSIQSNNSTSTKISLLDKNEDLQTRYRAVLNAWKIKSASVQNQLITILTDTDEIRPLRVAAARSLAKAGNIKVVEQVKKILAETEDRNLTYGLASALSRLNQPESINLLTEIACNSDNKVLRFKAIQALGTIGDNGTLDVLKRIAQQDSDKINRARAIIEIATIGKLNSLSFMEQVLKSEKDKYVKNVLQRQIELIESGNKR